MSAPQPPADETPENRTGPAPTRDSDAGQGSGTASYDFHGEKLDFDPYRFGAPDSPPPAWGTPPAATDPTRPPTPGERWSPGGDDRPDVRPGDYWQGSGSQPRSGDVFPPAGYAPPSGGGVDLAEPDAPGGYPPPGFPAPSAGHHAPAGYPPPGSYPQPPQQHGTKRGNGLAVAGLVVGIVGCVLALTSWPGLLVGLVGLGLAIAGLVRARRGGPRKGLAIAAVIVSALAVVASTVVLVVVLSRIDFDCVRDANGNFDQAQECVK